MTHRILAIILVLTMTAISSPWQETALIVNADQVLHRVSPYLTGACIEDVNHEIYGGIDSQLIFGESFAEPAPLPPLNGFAMFGGQWTLTDQGGIQVKGSNGAKIVWDGPAFSVGEASVQVWLTEASDGNGGLILKVSSAGKGADAFTGYEVSLERPGTLVIGRHRQNWEPIRRVPCEVPVNQWVTLKVRLTTNTLEVLVNGRSITIYEDTTHPLEMGTVGLRTWQRDVRFRNLRVTTGGVQHEIPFELAPEETGSGHVSAMWRALRRGSAEGKFALVEQQAFSGMQSQQITFTGGTGEIGVENRGLNRWGLNFVTGQLYEGYLWARTESPVEVFVALESGDGTRVSAESSLKLEAGDWQRLDFQFEAKEADILGRFAIKLKQPGRVTLGYAFLQPGPWGRFKGLPVRSDVAEGLIHQGVTVLRYGGSMINAPEYRWKNMIGARAQRPPYAGHWYRYSSNGWGLFDFLNFCEAAEFVAIPALNINETPQDMADFMDYLNGPTDSVWGSRRVADGHAAPYQLKHVQLGNEERVDESYWQKFKRIAEVIWAKDPDIILVVGDFVYDKMIEDPFNFNGAASRITTLAAHQKILKFAKEHHREVWFDVHVNTPGPYPESSLQGALSFADALEGIAAGAKHKVVVFELNANNHTQRRALANAMAINAFQRDGRMPVVASANCLQPDGQNDNGWNQGLLFLNPSQVWLQPPGHVTQMISQNYQPLAVKSDGPGHGVDVSSTKSEDGSILVLQIVNASPEALTVPLKISGFVPAKPVAKVLTLEGALDAYNTASMPDAVTPTLVDWRHGLQDGETTTTFPAYSFTIIRF